MSDIRFYDCSDDTEQLTAVSIADAVKEWADSRDGPLPETVEVFGYAPMELPSAKGIAGDVLERLYDHFADTDWANPDGPDDYDPPPELKAAALQFAEVFRKEYKVWACEQVSREVVKVADYYDTKVA